MQANLVAQVFASAYLPLVQHFAEGGNACVVSYGQKGLGKSGYLTAAKGGLIPLVLAHLFEAKKVEGLELTVLRIYNLCVASTHAGF